MHGSIYQLYIQVTLQTDIIIIRTKVTKTIGIMNLWKKFSEMNNIRYWFIYLYLI